MACDGGTDSTVSRKRSDHKAGGGALPSVLVETEGLAQGHFSRANVTVLSSTCWLIIISTPDRAWKLISVSLLAGFSALSPQHSQSLAPPCPSHGIVITLNLCSTNHLLSRVLCQFERAHCGVSLLHLINILLTRKKKQPEENSFLRWLLVFFFCFVFQVHHKNTQVF